jgi:hypothetical protein
MNYIFNCMLNQLMVMYGSYNADCDLKSTLMLIVISMLMQLTMEKHEHNLNSLFYFVGVFFETYKTQYENNENMFLMSIFITSILSCISFNIRYRDDILSTIFLCLTMMLSIYTLTVKSHFYEIVYYFLLQIYVSDMYFFDSVWKSKLLFTVVSINLQSNVFNLLTE